MTDLINKVMHLPVDEYNKIHTKFIPILETLKPNEIKDEIQGRTFVYLLNYCHELIETKHKDLVDDLKTWSVIVVKDLFLNNIIKTEEDIDNVIIEFVSHWRNNYATYLYDIGMFVDEYFRDVGFVMEYINKKIGK